MDDELKDLGMKLKAEKTLSNGCGVIIGCIIGSRIFASPTEVLASSSLGNLWGFHYDWQVK